MRIAVALVSAVAFAQIVSAQTPAAAPPTAAVNVSISGTVKDKNTGAPLKDYTVSTYTNVVWANGGVTMSQQTKQISSTTDESGHYKLSDLPADTYHVQAQGARPANAITRIVTVNGQDLQGIDFHIIVPGVITGKVIDENKEPVPNMMVTLVSREYYLGNVGYYLKGSAITNDLGEYTLANVEAGRPYLMMTEMRRRPSPPHAETPLNPKMRRKVAMRTWYPSSPDREGAAVISLRPGERREGVVVEVKKSPSYCLSGTAMSGTRVAAMNVWIEMLSPSSGISNNGGSFAAPTGTLTDPDGEFRFCDLSPGNYRLTVSERNATPDSNFAFYVATIADQDVGGLRIPTSARLSMDAEVALDGPQPQTPIAVKARVLLNPLFRTQQPGEKMNAQVEIPGTGNLSGLMSDDYAARATVNSPGLYVRDITFAGRSIRYEPLRLGSAANGSSVRVTIGQDGGTLTASVADKDGNPVSSSTIILMPEGTPSEAAMAMRIVSGQTNQTGVFRSETLEPGKYFVVATEDSYNMTPESIGKLWQSHVRYQEVEITPKGSVQVNLVPVSIQ